MKNLYLPQKANIDAIRPVSTDTRIYTLKPAKGSRFLDFSPGQIVMIGIDGVGEAPFGSASAPNENKLIIVVKKVGRLTSKIFAQKIGDILTFRKISGQAFPLEKAKNKNIALVAGGTGIAPIAGIIKYLIANKNDYGQITLLYGAKSPKDLIFRDDYDAWSKRINIHLCVEEPDEEWQGPTGSVTGVCPHLNIDPKKTIVYMVGPPPMYKATIDELTKLGVAENQIYLSLEARMRCGVGKCQHCSCGKYLACIDGPAFRYDKIKDEGAI